MNQWGSLTAGGAGVRSGLVGKDGDVDGLGHLIHHQHVGPWRELDIEVALGLLAHGLILGVEPVVVVVIELEDLGCLQLPRGDTVLDGLDLEVGAERLAVVVEQVDPQGQDVVLVGREREVLLGVFRAADRGEGRGVDLGAGALGSAAAGEGQDQRHGGADEDGQGLAGAVH